MWCHNSVAALWDPGQMCFALMGLWLHIHSSIAVENSISLPLLFSFVVLVLSRIVNNKAFVVWMTNIHLHPCISDVQIRICSLPPFPWFYTSVSQATYNLCLLCPCVAWQSWGGEHCWENFIPLKRYRNLCGMHGNTVLASCWSKMMECQGEKYKKMRFKGGITLLISIGKQKG